MGRRQDGTSQNYVYVYVLVFTFTILFPFAGDFHGMLALRILAGLGLGAQWGVGNTLVAEFLPSRVRILASSTIQTGFAFGPLLAAYSSKLIIPASGGDPCSTLEASVLCSLYLPCS